ncbi:putative sugar nucleotidyl transferase [Gemmatimonas sp.]|jgi:UDP-N-acetylglucosamine diphosphorylase/glucosamine-1-phosphate N-acetyltransferase|uniref:putative sugar nucleotidyl transferase n=1 Tax=Gemmatimonas sp. TaxID=1962908 RepID=UPI0037BEA2A3
MIVLLDDPRARSFEPFATTRPLGEVRAGAVLIRERWAHVLSAPAIGFVSSPHLSGFSEFAAPPAHEGAVPAGTWLVNTRALPHLQATASDAAVLSIDGRVAAVRVGGDVTVEQLRDPLFSLDSVMPEAGPGAGTRVEVPGVWLEHVWDLTATLQELLLSDIPLVGAMVGARSITEPQATAQAALPGVHVIGLYDVLLEPGAEVEPMTVFDTSAGPVLLRAGARVRAFTRVVGPCYVGRQSTVTADRIAGCSIGDACRVHGEVSSTIFIGHANKGHDGFVGHSVIGRWANLGAGTITSNLKNTYGSVSLWTPEGVRDTGLQFLGSMLGDHAKTGIGLRLTTGCVVGAGANVFDAIPPKLVPPFAWGGPTPYGVFAPDAFVDTAARVMSRRQVELSEAARGWWRTVHRMATTDPRWTRT